MTARAEPNHVIWDASLPLYGEPARADQMRFRCLHCGDLYALNLPCSISMLGVVIRQYVKEHRRCKPRPSIHREPEPEPEPGDVVPST